MDIYFPLQFVSQVDLEKHDKVSSGKYTIGLGQQGLAFVTDREDIYSITLTGEILAICASFRFDFNELVASLAHFVICPRSRDESDGEVQNPLLVDRPLGSGDGNHHGSQQSGQNGADAAVQR